MKCDSCLKDLSVEALAKYGDILLCVDCVYIGQSGNGLALLKILKEKRMATEETYERNYIAIMDTNHLVTDFQVVGFFSNHKIAWTDDNIHTSRDEAQDHAEFLMKEFSMGGENNPLAIFHLNDRRQVIVPMLDDSGKTTWVNTFEKVTDLL